MGIWDSIKQSAKEANEGAHARRLKSDLELTLRQFYSLGVDRKADCILLFLEVVTDIMTKQGNWSRDGAINLAKKMFKDAREFHDYDRSRSYAIALSGLWLESQYRHHEDAKIVFNDLSTLYAHLMNVAPNETDDTLKPVPKRFENHQLADEKNSAASVKLVAHNVVVNEKGNTLEPGSRRLENNPPAHEKNSAASDKLVVQSDKDSESELTDRWRYWHARGAYAAGDIQRASRLIKNITHPSLSVAKAVFESEINAKNRLVSERIKKQELPIGTKIPAREPPINQLDPLSALMLKKAMDAISENDFELAEKIMSREFPSFFEDSKREVVRLLHSKKSSIQEQ